MVITGTLVNMGAIIVGGTLGLLIQSRLPERVTNTFFQAIGLFTLYLGFSMSIKTGNPLILVFALILGGLVGSLLKFQQRIEGASVTLQKRLKIEGSRFSEGLVMAFLMFCMGSMTILGALEEGLGDTPKLLYTKSLMDGFGSIALVAAMGIGVIFSIIPMLLYQGGLTLLAAWLGQTLSTVMVDELTAVGGIMLIGLGINMLNLRKIEVLNILPALLFVIPLVSIFG